MSHIVYERQKESCFRRKCGSSRGFLTTCGRGDLPEMRAGALRTAFISFRDKDVRTLVDSVQSTGLSAP